MPTYEDEDQTITLFKNDQRRNDKDPEYRGTGKTAGVAVWASAWINTAKNTGTKYMKIKLRPKQEPVPTKSIKDDLDDEIRF